MIILPLSEDNAPLLYQLDARYLAGELVTVRVSRSGFQPEYAPLPTAEWRSWRPAERLTAEELLRREDCACYLAMMESACAGEIVLRLARHRLCEIVALAVDSRVRRQGVATELLKAGMAWAAQKRCKGFFGEASDLNPVACQFFQNSGFTLGGVDKLRHVADPEQAMKPLALRDSVLTFYRFFER